MSLHSLLTTFWGNIYSGIQASFSQLWPVSADIFKCCLLNGLMLLFELLIKRREGFHLVWVRMAGTAIRLPLLLILHALSLIFPSIFLFSFLGFWILTQVVFGNTIYNCYYQSQMFFLFFCHSGFHIWFSTDTCCNTPPDFNLVVLWPMMLSSPWMALNFRSISHVLNLKSNYCI